MVITSWGMVPLKATMTNNAVRAMATMDFTANNFIDMEKYKVDCAELENFVRTYHCLYYVIPRSTKRKPQKCFSKHNKIKRTQTVVCVLLIFYLSLGLVNRLKRMAKKMATAMPPAVAFSSPVKMPKRPWVSTACSTPFGKVMLVQIAKPLPLLGLQKKPASWITWGWLFCF